MQRRWDIFCTVIDNYGDIGVSWRLARQLACEHQFIVRLWVDDLASFARIAPDINPVMAEQRIQDVEIRLWPQQFIGLKPAEVVIEAFGCKLPDAYIIAMGQQHPVWINLEYLSAENWVAHYHGLPSPHPRLPLVKYFFFPGFVRDTGGLLRERKLLSTHNAFDEAAQSVFWQRLGIPARREKELRITLFCYDFAPLEELIIAWAYSTVPVYVLIPQGSVAEKVTAYIDAESSGIRGVLQLGQLSVQCIPFLEQTDYDRLLWSCDFNFVRGEDSFVRAQWARKPFVWHIYPQSENTHWTKLEAFLNLYTANMLPEVAGVVRALWYSWNGRGQINDTWLAFVAHQVALQQYNQAWSEQLCCQNDLASNLVSFAENRI